LTNGKAAPQTTCRRAGRERKKTKGVIKMKERESKGPGS